MRIGITRLWDGSAAADGEAASLTLAWTADSLEIAVDAPWHGDPAPAGPPGVRDGLWEHEVVELFLLGLDQPRRPYTEIELGPHGHHLGLRLQGVRSPVQSGFPIDWAVRRDGARWTGLARVDRALLPDPVVAYNAFAIHGQGADRRYLAHHPVPGPQPDFHRLHLFPALPGDGGPRRG